MALRRLNMRIIAAGISTTTLTAAVMFGMAPAHASVEDDRFLAIVEELGIPTNSPEEAVQVGRQICDTVEAGKIEPARTVRGIMSQLTAKGLKKGQATNLVWGAVGIYCPQYSALVGLRTAQRPG
ncbi:DUF732 domain-containing protein [Mycobacterium sp. 21AC1]|uniref:DUF732 domain-containing protein n=1 Tax=[Mycobacterium] appelbergii TaxID=2939269 RepID=UPI0029391954|nr:DUF732 domain-containing protein [Mycobacterium sp. 21AC1]MDV3130356.1 DUF732 domain-containing protein [Mycobacterium sp. 21AC1]